MKSLTVSAHMEPDSASRLATFDDFVVVRVGGSNVEISLLASPDTSKALRDLAARLNEAAQILDTMATSAEVSA
ncbi:hypothetical protein ACOKM3_23970 [Streptomyces sp. BH106]|uniref:hypothetical protein n=1 Tax=Streptomyces sp. BH106 TaxID=3410409 RepID=UPI003CF2D7DE